MAENNALERWLPVPDWVDYEVSDLGRIRSWKKSCQRPNETLPRMLVAQVMEGYHRVDLRYPGRRRSAFVHRLVLEAFVGPPSEGHQCRHLNGRRDDNRLANLAWGTAAENSRDKRRHGTCSRGERNGNTRISEETARQILAHEGTHADAARAFGVSRRTARNIRSGARWGHL